MFIYTAKLHRKRIILGAAALVLVCGFLATYAGMHSIWGAQSTAATTVSPKGLKTNEDRLAYLSQFGWTLSPEAITVEEIQLPENFDASYDDYLSWQTQQGFELDQFAGKRVKRYTYQISNYPDKTNAMASLLIYKNNVIGGEVFAADTGELLHGLTRPS